MIVRAIYTNIGMALSLFLYHACIYNKGGFYKFFIIRVHVFDGIYDLIPINIPSYRQQIIVVV